MRMVLAVESRTMGIGMIAQILDLIEPAVGQETGGNRSEYNGSWGNQPTGSSATDEEDSLLSKARQDSIPRVGILCLGSGLCFCTSSGYVRY